MGGECQVSWGPSTILRNGGPVVSLLTVIVMEADNGVITADQRRSKVPGIVARSSEEALWLGSSSA